MSAINRLANKLNVPLNGSPTVLAEGVVNCLANKSGSNFLFRTVIETNRNIFDLTVSINQQRVNLTPLYFVDRSQVPFTGPDDRSLDDLSSVQNFADKVADQCNISRVKVTWKDRMYLRLYLEATKDPDKAEEAFSFIILHEIGHKTLDHQARKLKYTIKLKSLKYRIINFFTLGIFKQAALDLQSRNHEKEADEYAYNLAREGAVYLFRTVRKFKPKGFEKIPYFLVNFSNAFTHGTNKTREKGALASLVALDQSSDSSC